MKKILILSAFLFTACLVSRAQDISRATPASNYSDEEIVELIYKYDVEVEDINKETELENLPAAVILTFKKSDYKNWNVVKVLEIKPCDKGERSTYMIYVENQQFVKRLHLDYEGNIPEKES